jgi:hypothetical protein
VAVRVGHLEREALLAVLPGHAHIRHPGAEGAPHPGDLLVDDVADHVGGAAQVIAADRDPVSGGLAAAQGVEQPELHDETVRAAGLQVADHHVLHTGAAPGREIHLAGAHRLLRHPAPLKRRELAAAMQVGLHDGGEVLGGARSRPLPAEGHDGDGHGALHALGDADLQGRLHAQGQHTQDQDQKGSDGGARCHHVSRPGVQLGSKVNRISRANSSGSGGSGRGSALRTAASTERQKAASPVQRSMRTSWM